MKDPRRWDRAGMRRALADPVNQRPVRFPELRWEDRDDLFDPDERQHVDRSQNRELNRLLRTDRDDVILYGDDSPEEESDA